MAQLVFFSELPVVLVFTQKCDPRHFSPGCRVRSPPGQRRLLSEALKCQPSQVDSAEAGLLHGLRSYQKGRTWSFHSIGRNHWKGNFSMNNTTVYCFRLLYMEGRQKMLITKKCKLNAEEIQVGPCCSIQNLLRVLVFWCFCPEHSWITFTSSVVWVAP